MSTKEEQIKEEIHFLVSKYYEERHLKTLKSNEDLTRIPYAGRVFDESDLNSLVDAALDFWLTTGKYAQEFEFRFKSYIGTQYCSLVNSGSSANLLAFMSLTSPFLKERQILPGDEVITVAAGFPTTVAPIIQYGAIPVFVDVTIPEYNIDAKQLESAISEKTKAVMIAHTLGNPFDIKYVKNLCEKNGLWLIEDACDALGSEYCFNAKWSKVGSFGDISTFSFYPAHHITMGEGGAICTSNPLLNKIVESMRDWGRDCWCKGGFDNSCNNRFGGQYGDLPFGYDHKYVYSHFGYNLKLTDMQASIGCSQLNKLEYFIDKRRRNWERLHSGLEKLNKFLILPKPQIDSNPSWFGFIMTVKPECPLSRSEIVNQLESNGIQTRMLFAGNLIRQPCFDEMRKNISKYRTIGDLKSTDDIMKNSFWIGVYPGLTDKMLEKMINVIFEIFSDKLAN